MRRALAISAFLLVAACEHPIQIMARDSAMMGSGVAQENGGGTGTITFTIGGYTYTGQWAIASSGTLVGFGTGTGTAFAGSAMATSFSSGTMVASTGQNVVTALLTAPGGKSMRCQIQYSGWTNSGAGVCQDGDGRMYDVMVLK